MISQRRLDELQLAAQARAEALFEKWQEIFLGRRVERGEEPLEEVVEEPALPETEVENAQPSSQE